MIHNLEYETNYGSRSVAGIQVPYITKVWASNS